MKSMSETIEIRGAACRTGLRAAGFDIPDGFEAVVVYSTKKPRSGDYWTAYMRRCICTPSTDRYECYAYCWKGSRTPEQPGGCLDVPVTTPEMERRMATGESFYGWIELEVAS